jgi:hypothetical protein
MPICDSHHMMSCGRVIEVCIKETWGAAEGRAYVLPSLPIRRSKRVSSRTQHSLSRSGELPEADRLGIPDAFGLFELRLHRIFRF